MSASAAAVANAVYHATGVRVRELPIRAEEAAEGMNERVRGTADQSQTVFRTSS